MRNALTPPPGTVSVEQYTRKFSEHSLQLLPMALRTVAFETGEAPIPVAERNEQEAENRTQATEERARRQAQADSQSTKPPPNKKK